MWCVCCSAYTLLCTGLHSPQLRFWATTVGRDKTYRAVQYAARFLAWYEYRKGASKETVARLTALKSNLGLSRKREWRAAGVQRGGERARAQRGGGSGGRGGGGECDAV
jgi:hypothetical protein